MTYSVLTWDPDIQEFTPQEGLSVPSQGITLAGVRAVLKKLRQMGYTCHRYRSANGSHDDNDSFVLVRRDDL